MTAPARARAHSTVANDILEQGLDPALRKIILAMARADARRDRQALDIVQCGGPDDAGPNPVTD